jgi:hypothetical protein
MIEWWQVVGGVITGGALLLIRQVINLATKVFRLSRNRSDLRLSLYHASSIITPLSTSYQFNYVDLTVTNLGRRPVQITGVGLLLKDDSTLPALTNVGGFCPFPKTLDERDPSVTASFEFLPLREKLTRDGQAKLSRLYCTLGTGQRKTARIRADMMKTLTTPSPTRVDVDD